MNVNKRRLEATLARDEGKDLERHLVDGIAHIGIGRNLDGRGLTDDEMEYLGVSDEDDLHIITDEQCTYLFDNDVELSAEICYNIFGTAFETLSEVRQEVLVNLAFNLGEPRLRRFAKMIIAIQESDWEEAADEMLDSKAAKQTGKRYNRLAQALEYDDGIAFDVEYNDDSDVVTSSQEGDALNQLASMEKNLSKVADMVATNNDLLKTIMDTLNNAKPDKKKVMGSLI